MTPTGPSTRSSTPMCGRSLSLAYPATMARRSAISYSYAIGTRSPILEHEGGRRNGDDDHRGRARGRRLGRDLPGQGPRHGRGRGRGPEGGARGRRPGGQGGGEGAADLGPAAGRGTAANPAPGGRAHALQGRRDRPHPDPGTGQDAAG